MAYAIHKKQGFLYRKCTLSTFTTNTAILPTLRARPNTARKLQKTSRNTAPQRNQKLQRTITQKTLKLICRNHNGWSNKKSEIDTLIAKHHPEILLLQETKLKSDSPGFASNGYKTSKISRNQYGGGLAILVKWDKLPRDIQNLSPAMETLQIILKNWKRKKNHLQYLRPTKFFGIKGVNQYWALSALGSRR